MANEPLAITSNSPKQTLNIAREFAKLLSGGEKIALLGELGSGKTTFVKGVARGLGIKKKITSPTFVLAKLYQFGGKPKRFLHHLDLYRLNQHSELADLGLAEIMDGKTDIVLVEWAERAQKYFPRGSVIIKIAPPKGKNENVRLIKIWTKK